MGGNLNSSALTAPLVLVVDDDSDVRALIGYCLEGTGYRVMKAASGSEALALVEDRRPDLAVIDVRMPGPDGLELTEILRHRQVTRDIPIVLLSALKRHEDVLRGFECGASDYLKKPFSTKTLRLSIDQLLAFKPPSSEKEARDDELSLAA